MGKIIWYHLFNNALLYHNQDDGDSEENIRREDLMTVKLTN